ncbi:MAG: autotransporter outer membrane beta-barrel domain-containing protein [Deltaproteobacteria bacterium]|jgi:hypothetical protein|nr:autotransporter outer membrane beta-barrel domain-containing protein [Deltaproteobacteria bacterium]
MGSLNCGAISRTGFNLLGGVGLVLVIGAAIILAWGGTLMAQLIPNITVNGSGVDTTNVITTGSMPPGFGDTIVPGAGSGGAIGNNVVVNGSITAYQSLVGGGNRTSNSDRNSVNFTLSGNISGNVFGGLANETYNATYNTVNINTTSTIGQNVVGGGVVNGTAEYNKVELINGTIGGNAIGGGSQGTGNGIVRYNEIIINGTGVNVSGGVLGGQAAEKGDVYNNSVVMYNGVAKEVYGGASQYNGSVVENNSVTIYNGTVTYDVIGGLNQNSTGADITVNQNRVEIYGGSIGGDVIGGWTSTGQASRNSVRIDNSTSNNVTFVSTTEVFGARTDNGSANENQVVIENINEANDIYVYGASINHSASANNNVVNITNVTVNGLIFGAYASINSTSMMGNKVSVVRSSVDGEVVGAFSAKGNIQDTFVLVADSNVSDISGSLTGEGNIHNSTVVITNSTSTGVVFAAGTLVGNVTNAGVDVRDGSNLTDIVLFGGSSSLGDVKNSAVLIRENSVVDGIIIGGESSDGAVTNNSVIIDGSRIPNASGNSVIFGGATDNGSASANRVTILNSEVVADIAAGYTSNGSATLNNLSIAGGNITGDLYGGYSERNGNATYNTVAIGGNVVINGSIIGGLSDDSTADMYTGNLLIVGGINNAESSIDTVENFQNYIFYLPSNVQSGYVALNASTVDLGPDPEILDIQSVGGNTLMGIGDTITLINAATPINLTMAVDQIEGKDGFLFIYDYSVYQDPADGSVKAQVIASPRLTPQVKAISETSAARMAFVNQGQDYIAENGISMALARTASDQGLGVFLGVSGGKSRYDTGSHVDLSGVNWLLGVAAGNYFDQNRLTLGLFGEFGFGSYESYTNTQVGPDLNVEGDVSYVGAGLMGRYDIQSSAGTLYLEASGRIGNAKSEFEAKNVRIANRKPSFKTSGTYVGAHAGVGYDIQVTQEADLDVYFKYLWNKQNGADERILGAPFRLEDATSSRIRTGGRVNYNYNDFIIPYVGGAYMYEFDGETEATAFGINLPHADLKGSSAMAELGVKLLNSTTIPISLDAGVQGYFGNRRGMSGTLDIKYEF